MWIDQTGHWRPGWVSTADLNHHHVSCSCQGDEKENMNMFLRGDDQDNMQITPMKYNTVPQKKMVE